MARKQKKDAVRNSHPQKGDANGQEEGHEEAEEGRKSKIGPGTALTRPVVAGEREQLFPAAAAGLRFASHPIYARKLSSYREQTYATSDIIETELEW